MAAKLVATKLVAAEPVAVEPDDAESDDAKSDDTDHPDDAERAGSAGVDGREDRSEPRGPLRSPGFWLHHAALEWRRQLDVRLAPLGLTHTQFNLLASTSWLSRDDAGPTQQQVADLAGADRMMASKVLTGLAQRGLLDRAAHPDDARAKRLRVSAEGRRLVLAAVTIVAEIDQSVFGPPTAQRERMVQGLERIVTAPGRGIGQ